MPPSVGGGSRSTLYDNFSKPQWKKVYVEPTEGIGLVYCVAPQETMREIP